MGRHVRGRVGGHELCQAGLASGAGSVPDELSDLRQGTCLSEPQFALRTMGVVVL